MGFESTISNPLSVESGNLRLLIPNPRAFCGCWFCSLELGRLVSEGSCCCGQQQESGGDFGEDPEDRFTGEGLQVNECVQKPRMGDSYRYAGRGQIL